MQVLLECCQIRKYINCKLTMEKLKSFQVSKRFALSGPYYPCQGVGDDMKQTSLYLCHPLSQVQWNRYNRQNHETYLLIGHHRYSGIEIKGSV